MDKTRYSRVAAGFRYRVQTHCARDGTPARVYMVLHVCSHATGFGWELVEWMNFSSRIISTHGFPGRQLAGMLWWRRG